MDKSFSEIYEECTKTFQAFLDNPNHTQEDCVLVSTLYSTITALISNILQLDFEVRLLDRQLTIAENALLREQEKNKKKVIH